MRNIVKKFSDKLNRPKVFRDKKNDYRRQQKIRDINNWSTMMLEHIFGIGHLGKVRNYRGY